MDDDGCVRIAHQVHASLLEVDHGLDWVCRGAARETVLQEVHGDGVAQLVVETVEHLLDDLGRVLVQALLGEVIFDGVDDLLLHAPWTLFNDLLNDLIAELVADQAADGVFDLLEDFLLLALRP